MKTHEEMVGNWMKDPAFKAGYDALSDEFGLFDEMLKARHKAGLTQAQIARKMGTKTPAIARLESAGRNRCPSPTLTTLNRYAEAVGCRLKIQLVPNRHGQLSASP